MEDKIILKDLKIDFSNLSKLGFSKEKNYYKYEKLILNNQFKLIIKITNNIIISDCIEISTNEKLIPYYILTTNGNFISKIRKEYNNIIQEIKNKCCTQNIFKSEYAHLIIDHVKNKYGDDLEYLWEKYPQNAIWRNKNNKKWYAALLVIDKKKIDLSESGPVEIIDLLLEPDKINKLVDNQNYFPGYHMNKKHWLTIKLDGSVKIETIYQLIDNSYLIVQNK